MFLSVPVNRKFRKYLRFKWGNQLLQWKSLPFGLKCSPRVVTKLLKPVLSFLRSHFKINLSVYMDDLILQAADKETVYLHTQVTILLFYCLGWEVNWTKTNVTPTQILTHLGFIVDTRLMTATCPVTKIERLQKDAKVALEAGFLTVHESEKLLGLMESMRPCTPMAAFYYRNLQKQLLVAKKHKRIPLKIIHLTQGSKVDLSWWVSSMGFQSNCTSSLREPNPTTFIWSDASMTGCGAHDLTGNFFQQTWTEEELSLDPHINVLELIAAKEAVAHLAVEGDVIRLYLDSQVAASYIRRQGGTKSDAMSWEACKLWELVQQKKVSLVTPHWISTKDNCSADLLSDKK